MPGKQSNSPEFRRLAPKWRLMTRLLGLPLYPVSGAAPRRLTAYENSIRGPGPRQRAVLRPGNCFTSPEPAARRA